MPISKYLNAYLVSLVLVVLFVMSLFVNFLTNRMIHYDVKTKMIKAAVANDKHLHYQNGVLQTDPFFELEDEGMHFQILDWRGNLLIGEKIGGICTPTNGQELKMQVCHVGSKDYYVLDRVNRKLSEAYGNTIFSRCIVEKSDIDSSYEMIKYIVYGSILIIVLVILFLSFQMSRSISEPLTQMSKTAAQIGKEGELSRRMEYDGRIEELSILADTNNYMLERLEDMFETQKRFSSDVAHELRTPIAVLMAQCEYAKEHADTKEELEESMDVVYRQVQKTNQIVTQLLNLNRMECGRIVPELEEVDLDEILCSICEDEERKDQVMFRLNLSGVRTQVDVGLMLILFQNIIRNAVKYSEKPAVVEIVSGYRDEEVFVSVKDYGCGMKKQDLEQIFQPFYRAEKARNSEGFGLGLSLADRIVKMHKGSIEVESEWGKGSTFTVWLPKR